MDEEQFDGGQSVGCIAYYLHVDLCIENADDTASHHCMVICNQDPDDAEMVAGRLPFQGDTLWAYVHKHVNEVPPRMKNVPGEVEKVVMKALAKDRQRRCATAPELRVNF